MMPGALVSAEGCVHSWGYSGRDGVTELAKIGVGCESPYWLRCSGCCERRLVRCGRPSMRACGPCGLRNKARVHRVASSGLHVGRAGLFVTVTAPSWVVHFLPNGDACRCTGGKCPDLASWNAGAGARFNRLMQDLRRLLGEDVQYFKAAEVQRRGALHFHVLLRGVGPLVVGKATLRALALKHGFGHEVDVQPVEPRHWGYVAKYASKAAGDRSDVPWRGKRWVGGHRFEEHVNSYTGEVLTVRVGSAERRQVDSYRATYRTWSASRDWGDTMSYVRAAQGHWSAVVAALPAWDGLLDGVPRGWACVVVPSRVDSG
jgi:hypothetical protein